MPTARSMKRCNPRSLFLLFALLVPLAAPAQETVTLRLPPASLAKWYKPENKRQVWLHTMFSLREAMQAAEEYTAGGDRENAERWAERFAGYYRKLPEMVPEWSDEVEPAAAEALVAAARAGDRSAMATALHRLGTTCDGCHNEYQATATALYRSPDYHDVEVPDGDKTLNYPQAMERLGRALNRVKIAFKDGRAEAARTAVDELGNRLDALETSCAECHRDEAPAARILGSRANDLLATLKTKLGEAEPGEIGRLLGEVGVTVCARCHSTHRTLAGLRHQLD